MFFLKVQQQKNTHINVSVDVNWDSDKYVHCFLLKVVDKILYSSHQEMDYLWEHFWQ